MVSLLALMLDGPYGAAKTLKILLRTVKMERT